MENQKIEQLHGRLIVSCQALPQEPLHSSFIMGRMALAAKQGGALGIRANTKEDIREIQSQVDLPVIGIVKRDYPDSKIYITPTLKEVQELMEVRPEIIALDATDAVSFSCWTSFFTALFLYILNNTIARQKTSRQVIIFFTIAYSPLQFIISYNGGLSWQESRQDIRLTKIKKLYYLPANHASKIIPLFISAIPVLFLYTTKCKACYKVFLQERVYTDYWQHRNYCCSSPY